MNIVDLEHIVREHTALLAQSSGVDVNLDNLGVSKPKQRQHGDFTSNIALRLCKNFSITPLELAQKLALQLDALPEFTSVQAVAPGFINFCIASANRQQVIIDILNSKENYGKQSTRNESVLLEFVSANPTGPLHIGHGRGAAYGASLANLLRFAGYQVHCEYYVNDAGRQMSILTTSLWIRYLQHAGIDILFPAGGYKGEYLITLAQKVYHDQPETYVLEHYDYQQLLVNGDTEADLDCLVNTCQRALGTELFNQLRRLVTSQVTEGIRKDLETFRVMFDNWFNEHSLFENNAVQTTMDRLNKAGALYNQDGATWFRAQDYGDVKDRVVCRSNGEYTYFATDIAYHADKFDRGFNHLINLFGADHHGYIIRLKAAMTALGFDQDKLEICMIQFANLMRGKEKVSMSTRGGEFVELSQLVTEIGADAARFFYLMRRHEQHLDFDIALATKQSRDNPVYYVQYAYARVSQIMHQAQVQTMLFNQQHASEQLNQLETESEQAVIDKLSRFPDLIRQAAHNRAPHTICQYLRELAALFHTYYANTKILDSNACWQARLALSLAVQQVLANGLQLLGVSAPQHM